MGASAFSGFIRCPTGRLPNSTQASGYAQSTRPMAVAAAMYPSAIASGSLTPA
jgi:hypothetical protein